MRVAEAVADGLVEMLAQHVRAFRKVSDRSSEAKDTILAPPREALECGPRARGIAQQGGPPRQSRVHCRVARDAVISQPLRLAFSRGEHALANPRR